MVTNGLLADIAILKARAETAEAERDALRRMLAELSEHFDMVQEGGLADYDADLHEEIREALASSPEERDLDQERDDAATRKWEERTGR